MYDFDELYKNHFHYVKGVCLRFVRDDMLAEDLAQETFIQIYKHLSSFRGESKVTTWMHRIAITQSMMYLRKRKLDLVGMEHSDLRNLRSMSSNPEETILLKRIITKLPKGYRMTFLLREVEGFTFPEIAEIMKYSEGSAKSQNFKAKAKLRRLISLEK